MSEVQVSTVTLSQAGVAMLLLDGEKHENAKTISRLRREIKERQLRLNTLLKRQEEIEETTFRANQLQLPGLYSPAH